MLCTEKVAVVTPFSSVFDPTAWPDGGGADFLASVFSMGSRVLEMPCEFTKDELVAADFFKEGEGDDHERDEELGFLEYV